MNLIAARLRLLVARARYTITKIRSLPLQYQLAVGQYMDIPADPASLAKHVSALSPEKRKAAEQWLADQDPELLPGLPDRMEGYLLRWSGHAPAKLFQDAAGTGIGTTSMPTLFQHGEIPQFGPFGSADYGRERSSYFERGSRERRRTSSRSGTETLESRVGFAMWNTASPNGPRK